MRRVIPKNRRGDYIWSLLNFYHHHKRAPKKYGGSLNDALFFLKTSDEILKALRAHVSDKEWLKSYVLTKAGDRFNVPTIAVLTTYEDAVAYSYPRDCVIKPTHMSGQVIFRKNGTPIDFRIIRKWFNSNFYNIQREANYKRLKPKLIIEPFVFGSDNCVDFKFFCIDGCPRLIQVDTDRHHDHRRNFYLPDWTMLPFSLLYPTGTPTDQPRNLDAMLDLARTVSAEFNIIRVDLYSDGDQIYVGELTNCPGAGNEVFRPASSESTAAKILFGNDGFSIDTMRKADPTEVVSQRQV